MASLTPIRWAWSIAAATTTTTTDSRSQKSRARHQIGGGLFRVFVLPQVAAPFNVDLVAPIRNGGWRVECADLLGWGAPARRSRQRVRIVTRARCQPAWCLNDSRRRLGVGRRRCRSGAPATGAQRSEGAAVAESIGWQWHQRSTVTSAAPRPDEDRRERGVSTTSNLAAADDVYEAALANLLA